MNIGFKIKHEFGKFDGLVAKSLLLERRYNDFSLEDKKKRVWCRAERKWKYQIFRRRCPLFIQVSSFNFCLGDIQQSMISRSKEFFFRGKTDEHRRRSQ